MPADAVPVSSEILYGTDVLTAKLEGAPVTAWHLTIVSARLEAK